MSNDIIYELVENEKYRQLNTVNLIASENIIPNEIANLNCEFLNSKYSEGYKNNRFYKGCEIINKIEDVCVERAKQLFSCNYANVQTLSGAIANLCVYKALLNIGDEILAMGLNSGGHLSHGSKASITSSLYKFHYYEVDSETGLINFDQIEDILKNNNIKLIVAGGSSYPRFIYFSRFGTLAKKYKCLLLADTSHISGMIITNLHPHPFPYADVVMTTTHKSLNSTRGAIILSNDEEIAKKIDRAVFPSIQAGPHNAIIAKNAVGFKLNMRDSFKFYIQKVLSNAKILASALMEEGIKVISDGTDNHIVLIEQKNAGYYVNLLEKNGIICNANTIPGEKGTPMNPSGIRFGTLWISNKGYEEEDMLKLAYKIILILKSPIN